jgi:2-phosphosulfolactate phosphatase
VGSIAATRLTEALDDKKMTFDQREYDVRFEWGLRGAEILSPICDAIVIVDVLSFTTAVSVAVSQGGIVFPYLGKAETAVAFAERKKAVLAGPRGSEPYSLSPLSLTSIKSGQRIVLPSPNGSTISLSTGDTPTYAGCLRNANAVAKAAMRHGPKIGVIACGERWRVDMSLRPALEDLIGAGAIIRKLGGRNSPEAESALWTFLGACDALLDLVLRCSSGKELVEDNHEQDVILACQLDADTVVPLLVEGAYGAAAGP